MKIFIKIFCIITIFTLSLLAQFPADSINNWKVSVNESASFAEFSGVVDFAKDSSIDLFTQGIDMSFYDLRNPIYAYYNAGGSNTNVLISFDGSSDPGLFDTTFFAETDSNHWVSLLTDQDLSAIVNYRTDCLKDTINPVISCFNKSFGIKYIKIKFDGQITTNSTAATVRWSFIVPKKLNAKSSGAFNIKDTRP